LKNTVALGRGRQIIIGQHIGDLATTEAYRAFEHCIAALEHLYEVKPDKVVCDPHPGYLSTQYAKKRAGSPAMVQHHHAHVRAGMAEHALDGRVLGVAWDGTGLGPDGVIWGGEFLLVEPGRAERVAHLRAFRLPGGDKAVMEPRRTALGLLYELFGREASMSAFNRQEAAVLLDMLVGNINCPLTTSAGRLFDALAALLGLCQACNFEGQAAMLLEFRAEDFPTNEHYEFSLSGAVLDWEPMLRAILDDIRQITEAGLISARFHNTLVEMIVAVARRAGEPRVVLSGGCFQNRRLTESAVRRLREEGFVPYWHQQIPPNDGGISLGQIMGI